MSPAWGRTPGGEARAQPPAQDSPAGRPGARRSCCWSCCRSPSLGTRAQAQEGLAEGTGQHTGGSHPPHQVWHLHPHPAPSGPWGPQDPQGTHTSSQWRWRRGKDDGRTRLQEEGQERPQRPEPRAPTRQCRWGLSSRRRGNHADGDRNSPSRWLLMPPAEHHPPHLMGFPSGTTSHCKTGVFTACGCPGAEGGQHVSRRP